MAKKIKYADLFTLRSDGRYMAWYTNASGRHALYDRDPERLRRACRALGGETIPGGDIGFSVELFDGLRIGVLFWAGDEEFLPRLRYLWDENAKQYIRYETMYFAVNLLMRRLREFSE